jgi:predicted component of type VI protein secretion system
VPLTLEVVGSHAAKMGAAARKVFLATGTIGRGRENDWVLPDEYISGRHAKILFANGKFMIEDTSANGVFLNSPRNRLPRGMPYTLRNGDTVYIDDYEVKVTVNADSVADSPPRPVKSSIKPVRRAARKRARQSSEEDVELDFAQLLAGAGIDSAEVTPEVAHQFGQILHVVVAGVMDLLRASAHIKDEFRMRMTNLKATRNNPLKFSANVEDALHNLLAKRNAAFLGPVEAFEDALQDMRNHQVAMLDGIRVAYQAMLAEFEPTRLQKVFDRQLKSGSIVIGPAKLKYWELYCDRLGDMTKDADSSFRRLFGDEFAKAYEEQLARLKAANLAKRSTAAPPRQMAAPSNKIIPDNYNPLESDEPARPSRARRQRRPRP